MWYQKQLQTNCGRVPFIIKTRNGSTHFSGNILERILILRQIPLFHTHQNDWNWNSSTVCQSDASPTLIVALSRPFRCSAKHLRWRPRTFTRPTFDVNSRNRKRRPTITPFRPFSFFVQVITLLISLRFRWMCDWRHKRLWFQLSVHKHRRILCVSLFKRFWGRRKKLLRWM